MITNSFRGDLQHIQSMLRERIPFSLSRYGDSEMMILDNTPVNTLFKGGINFQRQAHLRTALKESLTHNQENYFVGVVCPCCVGEKKSFAMKQATSLDDSKLTWANLFVNANFSYFQKSIVSEFSAYNITMVSPGDVSNLPLLVDYHYSIGSDAWIHNEDVCDKLIDQLEEEEHHHLVLLSAGPFANILCHRLFSRFPHNTIIDIGSVFNVELGMGANRRYLRGEDTLRKVCRWYR